MKIIIPFLVALFTAACFALRRRRAAASNSAQTPTRPANSTEPFSAAIEAVLHDLPSNLRHITGDLVLAEGEIEDYACTVEIPGAEHCVITRYHSASDTTASWQAKMYSNEDFEKASRQYHVLYNKLRSCYLLLADSSVVYLQGEWEPAREDIPFATSTLRLNTGEGSYGEVQVQLELVVPGDRLGNKYQYLQ